MLFGNVDLDNRIIDALYEHKLVIFAGAGISMPDPSNLPSFCELAKQIADGTGEIFQENEKIEVFLGRIEQNRGVSIYALAKAILENPISQHNVNHLNILKLFKTPEETKIVTTNFDNLFESAAKELWSYSPKSYIAPAIPLGGQTKGIVHLHGSVDEERNMILTDIDFGRAYLTEAWAPRYLLQLFQNFTVLFIGYSHDDTVMDYLARAMPPENVQGRFILTHRQDQAPRWEFLGIKPCYYSIDADGQHSNLLECLDELVTYINRSASDWHYRLESQASGPPPRDNKTISELLYNFRDSVKLRKFLSKAIDPDWLVWFEQNGLLNKDHFSESKEYQLIIAEWFLNNFTTEHSPQLWFLIAKHPHVVDREFANALFLRIARTQISEDYRHQWASLAAYWKNNYEDVETHFKISLAADKLTSHEMLYKAFCQLNNVAIHLKDNRIAAKHSNDIKPYTIEFVEPNIEFAIDKLWSEGIVPNFNSLHSKLLFHLIGILETRYYLNSIWTESSFDADNFSVASISHHIQNSSYEYIQFIIDCLRDTIGFIAENHPELLSYIYSKYYNHNSSLLKRLSLYCLHISPITSADAKIQSILDARISDSDVRPEIFTLITSQFGELSPEIRLRTLEHIEASIESCTSEPRITANEKFQWYSAINNQHPDIDIVCSRMSNLLATYPDLQIREYPELTHWTSNVLPGDEVMLDSEMLLSSTPAESYQYLSSIQHPIRDPAGVGLQSQISEIAQKQPAWCMNLITYISDQADKVDYIVDSLFWGLSQSTDNDEGIVHILQGRFLLEVANVFPSKILDLLLRIVRQSNNYDLLKDFLDYLQAVGLSLADNEIPCESRIVNAQPFEFSINSYPGKLTEYWIHLLSAYVNTQVRELVTPFDSILLKLSDSSSEQIVCVAPVLASQLSFLLEVNTEWTERLLNPLFTSDNMMVFKGAWIGFLKYGTFSKKSMEYLTPFFIDCLSALLSESIDPEEGDYLRSLNIKFIQILNQGNGFDRVAVLSNYFSVAKEEQRLVFAHTMLDFLSELPIDKSKYMWDSWLKAYWQNRISGIPVSLSEAEIRVMLEWTLHLSFDFADAIKLSTSVRLPNQDGYSHLLFRLPKHLNVHEEYDDLSKLLIYLLSAYNPYRIMGLSDFIEMLDTTNLSRSLRLRVNDALAISGYLGDQLTISEL